MSGKIIVPNAVKRRDGYIYYIDGTGSLCEAVRAKGRTKSMKIKKVKKTVSKIITKKLAKKVAAKTKPTKKVVKAKKKK